MTTEDKSLLRCTLKKSVSVVTKIVQVISCAVVGIAGFVILLLLFYYATMNIALPIWTGIITWSLPQVIFAAVVSILCSIPWYYYAGLVAVMAIPIYSFLWCVSRELTEEDWESESANAAADAVAVAFVVFAFVAAAAVAFVAVAFVAFVVAVAVFVVFADPVPTITVRYYVFRFPGAAWYHYMKGGAP